MKKWIFPLVLIILDLIFAILFMTPSIVKVLPQFLLWIRDLTIIVLSAVSKLLHLPTFVDDGQLNNVIANSISFFIITFLIIIIYFVIYFIVLKTRKTKVKSVEKEEIILPKSEFDPILFEKRVPIFRLVFMWIPLNLWILYFFLLNSYDLQEGFKKKAPGLYAVFEQNISFYNHNARPLFEKDDAIKFAILIIGLVSVAFLYWMIFSMIAIILKKPIAKAKANDIISNYQMIIKLKSDEDIIKVYNIIKKGVNGFDITSNAYLIDQSFLEIKNSIALFIMIFTSVLVISNIAILLFICISIIIDSEKEMAILVSMGKEKKTYLKIYLIEMVIVTIVAFLISFIFNYYTPGVLFIS